MIGLRQIVRTISRSISYSAISEAGDIKPKNAKDDDEDDEDDNISIASTTLTHDTSISLPHNAPAIIENLPKLFHDTLLVTSSSVLHLIEPEKTLGYSWLDLDAARTLQRERHAALKWNRPELVDGRLAYNGCVVWVWTRSPAEQLAGRRGPRYERHAQVPPNGEGGGTSYVTETSEVRFGFCEMAMVCVLVPPSYGMTERDLSDMCKSQEVCCYSLWL